MPTGPSEVLVIADGSAKAEYCTADLLAQAEHDPQSQIVLITTSPVFIETIQKELQIQLGSLPRQKIAAESLEKAVSWSWWTLLTRPFSYLSFCSRTSGMAFEAAEKYLDKIENAGCVFIGDIRLSRLVITLPGLIIACPRRHGQI